MNGMTQEQVLDKYIGKKGSPEREEYDTELRKTMDSLKAKEGCKRREKPVVVPYVPGLTCKYLAPDPFGTGR